MQSTLTSLVEPCWANADFTLIDCKITTSQFGSEVLPFTAAKNDVAAHGRAIFESIARGDYGAIAPYVAPPPPVQPTVVGAQTL
jgi:hypothetical protein